jgi:hypoxanthine phosphoribosyltransferase
MDVLIPEAEIGRRVNAIADEVNREFAGRPFTVIGILTGSLVFLADLIRHIEHPHQIGLIQASSYRGPATTAGTLVVNDSLLPDIKGRHVLLLDDILDTGQTLARLVEHMTHKGATSVKTCVLLRKLGRQTIPIEPDFIGFSIPDKFVIGYGLDFNDDYRHLPFIGVLPDDTAE